jgi:hypothetical protein
MGMDPEVSVGSDPEAGEAAGGGASQARGDFGVMSKDLPERVANLEAWVEVVMRTLATLGLENLLVELDEARRAYDEEGT